MNVINCKKEVIDGFAVPVLPEAIPGIKHGFLTDALHHPVIKNFSSILRWLHRNTAMCQSTVQRLEEFLFTIEMNKYDPAFVRKNVFAQYMINPGACSAVWKDGIVGRNFDWYFDDTPTFVIRVPGNSKRYSTLGVAKGMLINSDAASTGNWLDMYKALPYLTMDGVNEKGVYVNLNVVNSNGREKIDWTGKKYFAEEAIRVALDTCATAREAAELIVNEAYMPLNFHNYAFHFLVCDTEHAYVVEDGVMKEETSGHPIITNCRGQQDVFTNGKLDVTKLVNFDPYGAGVERYNKILDQYASIDSVDKMIEVMKSVFYTEVYKHPENFLSELCAKYDVGDIHLDLTVDKTSTDQDAFQPVATVMKQQFADRTRSNPNTWQTVHSSVYDLEKKEMILTVQEEGYSRIFKMDPYIR